MKTQIASLLVPTSLVILTALPLTVQDWPQWRGANRDGKSAGLTAPKSWPKELTQKWKVTVGEGDATPALAGDKLYVFSREEGNEVTRCLDAATGKELWQDKYESGGATGPASGHSGPRSSPTVADGKVITFGVRGTLSCLDAASGKKLWRKEGSQNDWPQFFTASSPVVTDGLCIAQTGGKNNGAIVAYALPTGDEKWKWSGDGAAYASPVLANVGSTKALVAETDKNVVALNLADGKLLWQTPFAGSGMGGYNAATPVVSGGTLIYGGSGRGTRAVKLSKSGDELNASGLWTNTENSVQFNSPVLKNGWLFAISGKDALFCVNAENGQSGWSAPGGGKRGFGSVVDAGSVLLALTPAAQLIVFEPDAKEFKQIASYKVSDSETYANPVVAGNRIYIKDKDSVTLWTLE
jgi:outer membrane protein assembly factor BamB